MQIPDQIRRHEERKENPARNSDESCLVPSYISSVPVSRAKQAAEREKGGGREVVNSLGTRLN